MMSDWLTLGGVVAVAILSLVGNIFAAKKQASKTEALIVYRLEMLEKKVDKHNSLVEWKYETAQKIADICDQLKDNKQRLDEMIKEG